MPKGGTVDITCPRGHKTIEVIIGRKPSRDLRFCPECNCGYRISLCHDPSTPASPPSQKDIAAGDAR